MARVFIYSVVRFWSYVLVSFKSVLYSEASQLGYVFVPRSGGSTWLEEVMKGLLIPRPKTNKRTTNKD